MSDGKSFRVGSRKSKLALIQTGMVVEELQLANPGVHFQVVGISTLGDKILDVALSKIGEKSLFTKELETALLDKQIDFVVHSLKDLPTTLPNGLVIAAIGRREDSRDAVLFSERVGVKNLADLPPGSTVGTSSLRRIAQLKHNYPLLKFIDIRGNLNTRLSKLNDPQGDYQAIILASAGVKRMHWQDKIGQYLEGSECMHAVGQGALGIECAEENVKVLELLKGLNHPETYFSCLAERALLKSLQGGCSVPIGVQSYINQTVLHLEASVWMVDGSVSIRKNLEMDLNTSNVIKESADLTSICCHRFEGYNEKAAEISSIIGINLGKILLENGAREILDNIKQLS